MSAESENNQLLAQPLMSNEPEQNVLVPQEYIDDEKGKMNTLEVAISFEEFIRFWSKFALSLLHSARYVQIAYL